MRVRFIRGVHRGTNRSGTIASMRIEGATGDQLSQVYVWLTPSEARELRDGLDDLVGRNDPSWHAHVSSADYETEIGIALDRA
jgi:hypothetical protein